MNIVDWLLIGGFVVFAIVGWRQGFVAGALSFLGFLGGGLLAVLWLPDVVERFVDSSWWQIVVVAVGVLVSAILGQALLSILGRRLRSSMTWRPVRFVDNVGGAALNVVALALVAWVVASIVAFLPRTDVTRQVNESWVLTTTDRVLPEAALSAFDGLRDIVGETAVPRVFAGLAPVEVIRDSAVRLTGSASACETIVTGSGFAIEPDLIVTNAHVVAGVEDLAVRVRPQQSSQRATVVYFDPDVDIALVRTQKLQARPVSLARTSLESQDPAVVAGFPRGERFEAASVRVRTRVNARGESIYGETGVERDVYVLRGSVEQGMSGGALTDEFGEVFGMVFASGFEDRATAYAGDADTRVANGSCELR